jgi:hypothetical protein
VGTNEPIENPFRPSLKLRLRTGRNAGGQP